MSVRQNLDSLIIREIQLEDCIAINKAFTKQGWDKPTIQYERYFEYQQAGIRDVLIAEIDGLFAGYLTIVWKTTYPSFRENNIPEVVDFNVLKKYQRSGIGTVLMEEAERRVKKVSKYVGIGVGLLRDYGAAQILYIRRGYIPDGNGITKDSKPINYHQKIIVDDGLVLHLIKEL